MKTIEEWLHNDIVEPVNVAIDEDRNGIIITGMGVGKDGSGTSTTLFHLAQQLAIHRPSQKICIVDLNLSDPCLDKYFYSNPNKLLLHLDSLYKQITETITKSMIVENTLIHKEHSNLYLLAGTRRPFSADSFSSEVLIVLMAAMKHLYDVVLVDISAHFDNPGTVAGLLSADHILAFSNYNMDGLRLFNLYHSTLFEYHPQVSQRMQLVGVETVQNKAVDLKHLTHIPVLAELCYVKELIYDDRLEGKQKGKYIKGLDEVLELIIDVSIDQSVQPSNKRKGGWNLWPMRRSSNSNA